MKRILPILMLAISTGCSPDVKGPPVIPVSGTVKLDDQPLVGARVTFLPSSDKLNAGGGLTDASGNYQVYYGSRSGLPAGEYRVTVSHLVLPDGKPYEAKEGGLDIDQLKMQGKVKQGLAPAYSDPKQTELKFKVESGSGNADFHLKK